MRFFPDDNVEECGDLIWEDRSYDPLWEIYSLKSNSWKSLNFDLRNCYFYTSLGGIGVYVDGVFHWWTKSESKNIEECLLSFDFSYELLITTPRPSNMDDVNFMEIHFVPLNGFVAMISGYLGVANFRISILDKLGVRESWINLFTVSPIVIPQILTTFLCFYQFLFIF